MKRRGLRENRICPDSWKPLVKETGKARCWHGGAALRNLALIQCEALAPSLGIPTPPEARRYPQGGSGPARKWTLESFPAGGAEGLFEPHSCAVSPPPPLFPGRPANSQTSHPQPFLPWTVSVFEVLGGVPLGLEFCEGEWVGEGLSVLGRGLG